VASKGVTIVYNWLLFPVVAGFLLVLTLSAYLSNYRLLTFEPTDGLSVLSSLAMVFVFTLIGSVVGLETFAVDPYGGMKKEPKADRWYVPLFLAKLFLFSTLFVLGVSSVLPFDISVYSLMAAEILFLLYLILRRPYSSALMNVGAILCELCTAYAFGLPILHRFYTPSEEYDVLLLFVFEGLLLLAEALTLVRVLKSYCRSLRRCLRKRDE
jgi:hypothetical protein